MGDSPVDPKELYLYIHYGGQLCADVDNAVTYVGGETNGVVVNESMACADIIHACCQRMNIEPLHKVLKYSLKYDRRQLQPLCDDTAVKHMFQFNDGASYVYIYPATHSVGLQIPSIRGSQSSEQISSNSNHLDGRPVGNLSSRSTEGDAALGGCAVVDPRPLVSGIWATELLGPGQAFINAKSFREALAKYAMAYRFQYQYVKNDAKKMIVRCKAGGCPWKLTAYASEGCEILRIRTFNCEHRHLASDDCSMGPRISPKYICSIIRDTIKSSPSYLPMQIVRDFETHHNVKLSYMQGWRSKEAALLKLNGAVENSYKLIPWICSRIVASNPGSVATFEQSQDGRFHRLFVGYGCSKYGFMNGCRQLLFIDACHLSGPYRGTLLSATALDADNQLYPLSYGVVGSENYDDWRWFLLQLRELIPDARPVIVSDRHQGILASVPPIFGNEYHSYCLRHLKENFSEYLNSIKITGRRAKQTAMHMLDEVAYARLRIDYDAALIKLHTFDERLATWVQNNSPDHWANSQFPHKRWDWMSTNPAESFNAWVKTERRFCIFSFVNEHRGRLASKLWRSVQGIDKWTSTVGPNIDMIIREKIARAEYVRATRYSSSKFLVDLGLCQVTVDLDANTCSCLEWQMTGIPCAHACAAIRQGKYNVYDYVENCYKEATQRAIYSELVTPVDTHDMPNIDVRTGLVTGGEFDTGEDMPRALLPPTVKRPPGRPRTKRIESQFQEKRVHLCSVCLEAGHNRATCKNPVPSYNPVDRTSGNQ